MAYWYVYMVRCSDGSLYTGATNDVAARLARHNAGKGARYTRARLPVALVWQKRVRDKSRALSVEYEIKQLPRAKKYALFEKTAENAAGCVSPAHKKSRPSRSQPSKSPSKRRR